MILLEMLREAGVGTALVSRTTHKGEYHGQCPIPDEAGVICGGDDRFIVWPEREGRRCVGIYFCRRCEQGGDALKFAIEILKMPYKDAVQRTNAVAASATRTFKQGKKNEPLETYLVPPSKVWVSKANALTEWAHKQLLQNSDQLKYLEDRGIPLQAIIKYKIGYIPNLLFRDRKDFGLDQEDHEHDIVSFPPGIYIPFIERSGNVTRLKVRRSDWNKDSKFKKYKVIPGSMGGMWIIGDRRLPVMIVVESELDAYALHHIVGDFAFIVAIGSNAKNLDNVTADIARTKKHILILPDNDEGGLVALKKWQKLYPHVQACPTPIFKDIGETIKCQKSFDIREWLLSKIPHALHPIDTISNSNAANDSVAQPIEIIKEPEKESVVEVLHDEIKDVPIVVATVYKTAHDWVLSDRPEIEWWLNFDRNALPQAKFYLSSVEPIQFPEEFYKQIDADIEAGPQGEAARCGSLQSKLIKLKRAIENMFN